LLNVGNDDFSGSPPAFVFVGETLALAIIQNVQKLAGGKNIGIG
jgi:hypothetical protein